MNNESKEALKNIFDNFDKDKSGFIELKELSLVSKELGDELKPEEVSKIMKELDINKDGRISFNEFWDWWIYGRANKLEKMVFLKLKTMNLLKKAHSDFTRFGANFFDKYDNVLDHHYFAFNLGESPNETLVQFRALLKNNEIKRIFDQIKIAEITDDFFGVILRFPTQNPDELIKMIEKDVLPGIKENPHAPQEFKLLVDSLKFTFSRKENNVLIFIHLNHPFFLDIQQNYKELFLDNLGNDFQLDFSLNFGFRNSIKQMMTSLSRKFVHFLFEGFLIEGKLSVNTTFLKNIRKTMLQKTLALMKEDRNKFSFGTLISLLHGSKVHIQFKDVQDVLKLFDGLGLTDLAEEQPTVQELFEELKTDYFPGIQFESFNNLKDFCQKHIIAKDCEVIFKMPEILISVGLKAEGMIELSDFLLPKKQDKSQ